MDTSDQWQDYQIYMKEVVLLKAANHFRVILKGEPVYGWRDRSIGSRVEGGKGRYWLRVVSEHCDWVKQEWWEGNVTADEIEGIPKPKVFNFFEWSEGETQFRTEIMSFVEGKVCSPTPELRQYWDLPDSWWKELRVSLDAISTWSTDRMKTKQEKVTHRFLVFYGDELDSTVTRWSTAHGDFHWGNLMAPKLSIIDWEGWGKAPVGMDAATLYCFSLLVPDMAKRVYQMFADILDSSEGRFAQLFVITRLLRRIDQGDFIELAGPLHHLKKLLL